MTKLVNRAKMTTATTGTGTISLASAADGYQTFANAGVANADVVRYVIEDGTNWEIGTGTYTASGTTLTRTVSESSNADAALNLTGSAVVYVSATAEDIPPVLELYAENYDGTSPKPSATGVNAVAIGRNATATQDNNISIGINSDATGLLSSSFGIAADSAGGYSTALGYATNTSPAASFSLAAGASAQTAGQYAVALANSYASGSNSFAAAIANNTSSYGATGASSVAIGYQAKANIANGTAIGGVGNIAGSYATAIGGTYNSATGQSSFAIGEYTSAAQRGKIAFGASQSGVLQQGGILVLRAFTSDATPKALYAGGSTVGANQIILPNNSAYAFHGTIVAREQASAGTDCAAWKIEGLIRREGSAGTTVLVNSATTVLDNTPAWGMALSADTTNGGLKIEVTGAAATNIRWVATINTSEVTY